MVRQPYFANTLIKVELSSQTVTAPGEDRQGVVLFPLPRVETSGRLTSPDVVLDTSRWLVHDVIASTLPAQCASQTAAQLLTDMWIDNVATGSVDPRNAEQVAGWCKWFVDKHPDCAIYTPMAPPPAGDALTTAVVEALATVTAGWPTGTDAEAAAELTTTLPPIAGNAQTEARPIEDQAGDNEQEEAS